MIVQDKLASIEKANEISSKIMAVITEESKQFQCEDDPAENAYLIVHVISILTCRICLVLEKYSLIYGIEKMNKENIYTWIEAATKEYLKMNNEKMYERN